MRLLGNRPPPATILHTKQGSDQVIAEAPDDPVLRPHRRAYGRLCCPRSGDRIAELEDDGIIMEQYAGLIPAELKSLAPEERHNGYGLLRLQVVPRQDGNVEMTGVIGAANNICQGQTTSG